MSQLITIQVPQDWVEGVPDEDVTLKEIFRMGLREYKINRAVQLYKNGIGSISPFAHFKF